MSQEELGEILGVKKAAIQKYESGAVTDLKASTIRTLCDTFDTYPWFFIAPEHHSLIKELVRRVHGSVGEKGRISQADMIIGQILHKKREIDILMLIHTAQELSDKGFDRLIGYASDLRQIKEYMRDIRPRQ